MVIYNVVGRDSRYFPLMLETQMISQYCMSFGHLKTIVCFLLRLVKIVTVFFYEICNQSSPRLPTVDFRMPLPLGSDD